MLEAAFTGRALIALDFDLLAFNRTTHAAFLFKRFEMAFNSRVGREPLITVTAFPAPFGLREILTMPSPTWLGRLLRIRSSDSPVTLRTKSTLIRAVHRVAFDFFLHDLFGVFFTSPAV